jgi:hypothetical protein
MSRLRDTLWAVTVSAVLALGLVVAVDWQHNRHVTAPVVVKPPVVHLTDKVDRPIKVTVPNVPLPKPRPVVPAKHVTPPHPQPQTICFPFFSPPYCGGEYR